MIDKKKLKKQISKQQITMTQEELDDILSDYQLKAAEIINLIPLLILRDKFGFGKVRLERYLDHYYEAVEAFNEGYLNLKDIELMMRDELGISIGGSN